MTEFTITKIRNLEAKYNDYTIFMAITHLFDKGVEAFKQADVEAACAEIQATTSEKSIISADLQEQILRCAAELAQFDICDILHYVQTDVRLHNVANHPCLMVRIHKEEGGEVCHFAFPAETDPYAVEEICDRVSEQAKSEGKTVTAGMLYKAFRNEGLQFCDLPWDLTLYV